MTQEQQMGFMRPFLKEVKAAIKRLNGEGAPSLDGNQVFFFNIFWEKLIGKSSWHIWKTSRQRTMVCSESRGS